jgi:hypothetical protein
MAIEISDAVIGLVGVIVGAGAGYFGSRRTDNVNLKIAQDRLDAENRISNEASKAIKALLQEPEWELRSFEAIRKHVRGFSDDELRQLLVACGAISFEERDTRRELWGLRERNVAKLQPKADQEQLEVEQPHPSPE